jgi:hypothetical protein
MAYRVLSRYRRTNPAVPWHSTQIFDQENYYQVMEMMLTDFHEKKVRTVTEVDQFTLEVEFIWQDQATYEDWASRSLIIQQQEFINSYNASAGITADPREKTEI